MIEHDRGKIEMTLYFNSLLKCTIGPPLYLLNIISALYKPYVKLAQYVVSSTYGSLSNVLSRVVSGSLRSGLQKYLVHR